MTVPTAEGFDWGAITGTAVERLRKPKTKPVPPSVVALAQRSFDGVPHATEPGRKLHVLEHKFDDPARAESFAKLVKSAGAHTSPQTTVLVVIDPENTGDKGHVRWSAGHKRTRTVSS